MLDRLSEQVGKTKDFFARLLRIICVGEVIETDPAGHRARVRLPGQNNVKSAWLQVGVRRSLGVRINSNLQAGEQVLCLFPPVGDMQRGFIVCSLYNDADRPYTDKGEKFGVSFDDGTLIEYDQASGTGLFSLRNGVTAIELTADGIVFTGPAHFKDGVTMDKTLNATGAINSASDISDAVGSIRALRVVYNGHTHHYNDGTTEGPNQPVRLRRAVRRSEKTKNKDDK